MMYTCWTFWDLVPWARPFIHAVHLEPQGLFSLKLTREGLSVLALQRRRAAGTGLKNGFDVVSFGVSYRFGWSVRRNHNARPRSPAVHSVAISWRSCWCVDEPVSLVTPSLVFFPWPEAAILV